MFLLSQDDTEFECPENCKCDINNHKIKCWEIEDCPDGTRLCPDGTCQEECDIAEDVQCPFGCSYNKKCLPIGVRSKDMYCSIEGDMKSQLSENEACDNNFECESNLCVSDQCVSDSLIKKILNWFKKSFGSK